MAMKPSECTIGTRIAYQPRWAGGETVKAIIEKEQVPLLTYLVRIIHPENKRHGLDTDLVSIDHMALDEDPRGAWGHLNTLLQPEQAPTADDARAQADHVQTWRPPDEPKLTEDTVPNDEWDRIQREHRELFTKRRDLAMILQSQANDVLCGLSFELPEHTRYAMDMEENTYKIRKLAYEAFRLVLGAPRD